MGVVYRARHLQLGHEVALKLILDVEDCEPELLERFAQEGRTLAQLKHPHLVSLLDAGRDELGRPWLAMELVQGGDLASRLAQEGPLDAWEARELVASLAEALGCAHQRGILHRDVKPANVLIRVDDGAPLLTDFGLATRLDRSQRLTQTGEVLGSPGYLAPEQCGSGQLSSPATDVYGLGALLYALLTGQPPCRGTTLIQTLQRVLEQPPEPPSRLAPKPVPSELERVCLRCLAKDPAARYRDGDALSRALRAGEPAGPRPGWRVAAGAAAILAALGLGAGLASLPSDPPAQVGASRPGAAGSAPGLAPAPTGPAPTDPAPTDPAPTDPAPTDPAPTDPAPPEPALTDPASTNPAPTGPAPTDPTPGASVTPPSPTPLQPGPGEPGSSAAAPADAAWRAFLAAWGPDTPPARLAEIYRAGDLPARLYLLEQVSAVPTTSSAALAAAHALAGVERDRGRGRRERSALAIALAALHARRLQQSRERALQVDFVRAMEAAERRAPLPTTLDLRLRREIGLRLAELPLPLSRGLLTLRRRNALAWLKHAPSDPSANCAFALDLLSQRPGSPAARVFLERALDAPLPPSTLARLRTELANVLEVVGADLEAAEHWLELVRLEPEEAASHRRRALQSLFLGGELARARRLFEPLARELSPVSRVHLAWVRLAMGEPDPLAGTYADVDPPPGLAGELATLQACAAALRSADPGARAALRQQLVEGAGQLGFGVGGVWLAAALPAGERAAARALFEATIRSGACSVAVLRRASDLVARFAPPGTKPKEYLPGLLSRGEPRLILSAFARLARAAPRDARCASAPLELAARRLAKLSPSSDPLEAVVWLGYGEGQLRVARSVLGDDLPGRLEVWAGNFYYQWHTLRRRGAPLPGWEAPEPSPLALAHFARAPKPRAAQQLWTRLEAARSAVQAVEAQAQGAQQLGPALARIEELGQRWVEEHPRDWRAHFELTQLRSAQDRFAEAVVGFERTLAVMSAGERKDQVRYELGTCLAVWAEESAETSAKRAELSRRARRELEAIEARVPLPLRDLCLRRLVVLGGDSGRARWGERLLEVARERGPQHAFSAQLFLAQQAQRAGDLARARAGCEAALRVEGLSPQQATFAFTTRSGYERQAGELAAARRSAEAALDRWPSAGAFLALARVQRAAGELAAARRSLAAALERPAESGLAAELAEEAAALGAQPPKGREQAPTRLRAEEAAELLGADPARLRLRWAAATSAERAALLRGLAALPPESLGAAQLRAGYRLAEEWARPGQLERPAALTLRAAFAANLLARRQLSEDAAREEIRRCLGELSAGDLERLQELVAGRLPVRKLDDPIVDLHVELALAWVRRAPRSARALRALTGSLDWFTNSAGLSAPFYARLLEVESRSRPPAEVALDHSRFARSLGLTGRTRAAVEHYERAIALAPTVKSLAACAVEHLHLGQSAEALAKLERARALAGEGDEADRQAAALYRAWVHVERRDPARLEEALARAPAEAQERPVLDACLELLRLPAGSDALDALGRRVRAHSIPPALLLLAERLVARARRADREGALDCLERAFLGKCSTQDLRRIGELLTALGQDPLPWLSERLRATKQPARLLLATARLQASFPKQPRACLVPVQLSLERLSAFAEGGASRTGALRAEGWLRFGLQRVAAGLRSLPEGERAALRLFEANLYLYWHRYLVAQRERPCLDDVPTSDAAALAALERFAELPVVDEADHRRRAVLLLWSPPPASAARARALHDRVVARCRAWLIAQRQTRSLARLAALSARAKRYAAAIESYDALAELPDAPSEIRYQRGCCWLRLAGEAPPAERARPLGAALDDLLAEGAGSEPWAKRLLILQDLLQEVAAHLPRRFEEAVEVLLAHARGEQPPQRCQLETLIAREAAELERYDDSIEHYQRALALGPPAAVRARLEATLAHVFVSAGQPERGRGAAQRSLDLQASFRGSSALARALLELNDLEGAQEALDRARRLIAQPQDRAILKALRERLRAERAGRAEPGR